jgi:hypothetical protein
MAIRIRGAAAVLLIALVASACTSGTSGTAGRSPSAGPPPSTPAGSAPSSDAALPREPAPPAPPSGAATDQRSGIEGAAVVDGGCPVARDSPCPDRPYRTQLVVTRPAPAAGGAAAVVARTQTDANGRFRVPLPPGRYVVTPVVGARLPRADPVTVDVQPGRYTAVTVRFDSGIR